MNLTIIFSVFTAICCLPATYAQQEPHAEYKKSTVRTIEQARHHVYGNGSDLSVTAENLQGIAHPDSLAPDKNSPVWYLDQVKTSRSNYEYEAAIEFAKEAQKLAAQQKKPIIQADALRMLGLIYHEMGMFQKGYEYSFQGLKIYENQKYDRGIILSLNNIANSFADIGKKDKAGEFYKKSLKIAEAASDSTLMSMLLHNLGYLYMESSQYDLAQEYIQESIALNRALKRELEVGISYMAMGRIDAFSGNDVRALEQLDSAYEIFEKYDSKIHLATINLALSQVYLNEQDFDQSLQHANKSYEIGSELNLESLKIPAAEQLYKIYNQQGDPVKAVAGLYFQSPRLSPSHYRLSAKHKPSSNQESTR